MCKCFKCDSMVPFPGVIDEEQGRHGLCCPVCGEPGWGINSDMSLYGYISNRATLLIRECLEQYYDTVLVCDDPACATKTRQQSVMRNVCSECNGVVNQVSPKSSNFLTN